ncbi:NPCBM/NEW2 domain-containing protein [Micromonospora sp. CB01531]|uniref:NPCBM/NEW2 domain-containing protein n=1 Tax=Micromonospora sp. CB01531 TaxID=1718947 RepID=UPI00093A66EE|nr:NPCBM/NEW2 domain-containing protein [Micromonospora sp. CB01531]OKI47524.1 hypothetical protein A6A27_36750 [Micromonospora sp. CB01531]
MTDTASIEHDLQARPFRAPSGLLQGSFRAEKLTNSIGPALDKFAAVARDAPLTFRAERRLTPPPPAPTTDSYLSDLPWVTAVNGCGPVELDTSNGKQAAGDGTPISFGGTVHAKGLGVHSYSDVTYHLGGRVARFTAVVGIDDFSARQSSRGNTIAEVWADDRLVHTSGVLRASTGPEPVDVDVRGARLLRLIVRAADSGTSYNHTSWADAFVRLG